MSERSFRRDHQRRLEAENRRRQRRTKRVATAAVAAGAFALAAPAVSNAATLTVGSNADGPAAADCLDPNNTDCTLRQALSDAQSNSENDTIVFASSVTGTITLGDNLYISDPNYSITVQGPGRDNLAVDGNGNYYIDVKKTGGPTGLTISGLKFQNGHGTYAGMIYAQAGTDFTLSDSAVTGSDSSGGTHSSGCCPPTGYFAASGGGITGAGRTTIEGSDIYDNYSGGTGPFGGGGVDNAGKMTISNSTISGNYAEEMGGGVFNGSTKYPASVDISNSTISDNQAQFEGGGLTAFDFFGGKYGSSRSSIENTTISGNTASSGGAINFKYVDGRENWTISHSTLGPNNKATSGGPSSYNGEGGGMFLGTIEGNLSLVDSTISGNAADSVGGGAYLMGNAQKYPGAVQFENSTIASNTAGYAAGGIALGTHYNGPGSGPSTLAPTPIDSTIVADNTAGGSPSDLDQDSGGIPGGGAVLSHSLVESPHPASTTENPAGSNIFGVDPQLGALGNNGGPTLTELPAPTSPVVDKGAAPGTLTTDQRGAPRQQGAAVDIGSVELPAGPTPPPPNGNTQGETKLHGIKKKHHKRKHVLRTHHDRTKVHITFSSTTPGATFRCSVDGGPAQPCTSPFTAMLSSAPGKGKVHTITITTLDANGNVVPPPRVVKFRIIRV
jgi:hypothetical protein